MKREEVLAVYDELVQSAGGCEPQTGCITCEIRAQIRNHIASALDDAERYRWLRTRLWKSDVAEMAFDYPTGIVFGPGIERQAASVDRAIDTARAAAAGGEEVL